MPKVSIIILNWNGLKDTIECLESLKGITYSDYEVIVVDNGSKGNDADILENKYKGYIRLIRKKENLGFAEGNNVGIAEALKDERVAYICCLNNDIVVDENFLTILVENAARETYKTFGSFQPKMIQYHCPKLIDSAGLEYSRNGLGFNRGGFEFVKEYSQNSEIFGCCGGAVLYRREAVENVISADGFFFDPDFFAYYEDTDLSFRLQLRGWKSLYVAKSIVFHKRGESSKNISKTTLFWRHRNNVYVLAKDIPLKFLLKFFFLILIAQLASVGVNFLKSGSLGFIVLRAKIAGFSKWTVMRKRGIKLRNDVSSQKNWIRIEKMFVHKWRVKRICTD